MKRFKVRVRRVWRGFLIELSRAFNVVLYTKGE